MIKRNNSVKVATSSHKNMPPWNFLFLAIGTSADNDIGDLPMGCVAAYE